MTAIPAEAEESPFDPVEAALALYDGDERVTIGALLETLQFVRSQLVLTEAGMSVGFTRGWKPNFEPQ
jgi:hypothetical protein